MRGDVVAKRRLRAGRAALGDSLLEIVVEELVRIGIRRVGRQKQELDQVGTLVGPGRHGFGAMNAKSGLRIYLVLRKKTLFLVQLRPYMLRNSII